MARDGTREPGPAYSWRGRGRRAARQRPRGHEGPGRDGRRRRTGVHRKRGNSLGARARPAHRPSHIAAGRRAPAPAPRSAHAASGRAAVEGAPVRRPARRPRCHGPERREPCERSRRDPAAPRGRDTTDRPGDGAAAGTGHAAAPYAGGGPAGQLLGEGERDRLGQRLHHALAGFVDSPHDAVAEAAEVLAAAERELIAALKDRSTALRAGWQENGDPDGPGPDTEQLRITLRTYREVTERLLRA
ncbi:hypothetical protein ACFU51_26700 [Streptomyces sp. NPDC057430]|uniref:hypothetical protein n=1 Tax=Streptomyces sp. NPDC057430 TaxID=3346131 RepID=UPI00368AC06D